MNPRHHLITLLLLCATASVWAQRHNLADGLRYDTELAGVLSTGDEAPLWFSANRFGVSSTKPNWGYLRGGIFRDAEMDSAFHWKYGYGIDLVVPVNFTSHFMVQQLYGSVQWKNFRVTLGVKEYHQDLLDDELSTGAMALSNNARPIPQVRLELPKWWVWHFAGDWIALKGHLAYGMYTDSQWQSDWVSTGNVYTRGSLFHSKAGFCRIGNEKVFPLTATIGFEMMAQFGGHGYNIKARTDSGETLNDVDLGNNARAFWDAFIPGGNDVNDGDYSNVAGNQLGAWHFDLKYQGKGWSLRGYAQHYFDDHSQLFFQYGWKDMLWGLEAELPRNPVVSHAVVEYLRTDDQTGGLYHDASDVLPIQMSGRDNYYNNHIYGAWQHWGQALGNPLLLSPIYNTDGVLMFYYNRVRALHVGIEGDPLPTLHYRLKYTHLRTWGTYNVPTVDPLDENYLLAELTWTPRWGKGFSVTGQWGLNTGDLLSKSNGIGLTIRKTGWF